MTALRAAFPGTRAHVSMFDPTAPDVEFLVVGTVEDPHDLASWYPRRLRIRVAMLDGCRNERALADLVAEAVPRMQRGKVVELGVPPRPKKGGALRLGRRVDPEELRTPKSSGRS